MTSAPDTPPGSAAERLTTLYHTREEMEVMHRLVQRAIDDCPGCAGKVRGVHHTTDCPGFQLLNGLRTMWAEAIAGAAR